MTTLTITLPDEVAELALEKGLLSSVAIEAYVREKVKEYSEQGTYPPGFDHRLKGAVNPAAYRRGRILGDIVSPIDVEWEAEP